MRVLSIATLAAVSASFLAPVALADNCTALANTNWCSTFTFPVGKPEKETLSFGADGTSFTLGETLKGNYICWGRNFLEVDYPIVGGAGAATWIANVAATAIAGHAKNTGPTATVYKFIAVRGSC
jgi:hypothetical protein